MLKDDRKRGFGGGKKEGLVKDGSISNQLINHPNNQRLHNSFNRHSKIQFSTKIPKNTLNKSTNCYKNITNYHKNDTKNYKKQPKTNQFTKRL